MKFCTIIPCHYFCRAANKITYRMLLILCIISFMLFLRKEKIENCSRKKQNLLQLIQLKMKKWPPRHIGTTTKIIFKGHRAFFYEYRMSNCLVNNCIITYDTERIKDCHAVLINWFFQPRKRMRDLRKARNMSQRWVYTTMEAPSHEINVVGYGQFEKYFKKLNGIFNWTMTYRLDSDIPRRYGRFVIRHKFDSSLLPKIDIRKKSKNVVWLVSNCFTTSMREKYVKELKKYIDVDIIGKCGRRDKVCDDNQGCYEYLEQKYKFYLAFENSICEDYITEKSFNILRHNIIPVVMGGANYTKFLPSGSYIDFSKFQSPRHLANFLISIGQNEAKYNKYFEWRSKYKVEYAPGENEICDLCRKLNDPDEPTKFYQDFDGWWRKKARCRTWKNEF